MHSRLWPGLWPDPGRSWPDRVPMRREGGRGKRTRVTFGAATPGGVTFSTRPLGSWGAAVPAPEPVTEGDVESIDELLVKKEAQAEEAEADEEEDVLVSLTREERLEPLDAKVVPPTTSEFVCKHCFLVKHKSQLKDKKRMLCRDCA